MYHYNIANYPAWGATKTARTRLIDCTPQLRCCQDLISPSKCGRIRSQKLLLAAPKDYDRSAPHTSPDPDRTLLARFPDIT